MKRNHPASMMRGLVTLALFLCAMSVWSQLPPLVYEYLAPLPQHSRSGCIFQDSHGLIWIAYEAAANRIVVFDGRTNRQILPNPADSTALPDGNIEEIIEGPDGKLWMATINRGLCVYDPETDAFRTIDVSREAGLQHNTVRDLKFDQHGTLWLTCRGALVSFDPSTGAFETFRIGLPGMDSLEIVDANRMHSFIEDPNNRNVIWIGTLGGLISFDRPAREFTFHRSPYTHDGRPGRGFAQRLVIDLEFLDGRTLALGTWSGGIMIYRTDNGAWAQFYDPRRTPEFNIFYDVERKSAEEIWVNSNVGFGVFSLETELFYYYDSIPIPHEYPGGRYATQMFQLNARDLIVVGSSGGILGHFEGQKPEREVLYQPYVSAMSVDGEPVRPRHLFYTQNTITVGRENKSISFEIHAPRYFQPDSVYYRFQIIGVDRTWREMRGQAAAEYALEGGEFELRYQASIDGETWLDGAPWTIDKYISFWQSRELKYLLALGLMAAMLLYFFLTSRQKRKQKELEQAYQHLLAESEMSALRAQMNPHFIFNSLNSIKMHVMKQDTQVANHYLTRFSHLMRLVLRNSKSKLITLSDELQALELYIEIEKLRFDDGFESSIELDDSIDPDELYIPPMLVQPYVENAIWHGLMHKSTRGTLRIALKASEGKLHLTITDDGVGRAHSSTNDDDTASLRKSYGMRITSDRIALIKQSLGIDAAVQVHDLVDDGAKPAGTRVELILPVINAKQARRWLNEEPNHT